MCIRDRDKSSDFLYKCLYKAKISNQPYSVSKNDGLKLYNAYITTALKCVPPNDKPTSLELKQCSSFFRKELKNIKKAIFIVALGRVAFEAIIKYYTNNFGKFQNVPKFGHDSRYQMPDSKILIGSYHPSPRNVNTGRLNEFMMIKLFKNIIK